MNARKWLFVAGCALSAALLGAILWRLDWTVFADGLRGLRYEWLAAAVAFIVAGITLRTARWRVAAGVAPVMFRAFWNANAVGLLVNHLYPLRAGEIFRILAVRQMAQVPLGRSAMSAFVDRLADLLILGVSALLVVASHTGPTHAGQLAGGALAAILSILVGLIVFTRGDRLWRRWLAAWSDRMSARLHERIQRFYSEAMATAALLGSPAHVAGLLAITAGCFCLDFAVVYCVLKAFGWDLPLVAAVTVLVFLAIGTSLPSAPGYAGVYQVACIFALRLFGIAESQAVAYSIVLQVCVLLTIIALAAGVALVHREELKLVRGALGRIR